MKIPKYILNAIKSIELHGAILAENEATLYKWLESRGIKADEDDIDNELDFLMHSHDGSELIERLENWERE